MGYEARGREFVIELAKEIEDLKRRVDKLEKKVGP